MSLKRITCIALSCAFFMSACSEQAQEARTPAPVKAEVAVVAEKVQMRAVEKSTAADFSAPAFLRVNMPEQAMAYLRVPSFMGLADVQGTIYDAAHQSAAYKSSLQSIRQGMIDNLVTSLSTEPGLQLLAQIVIENLRSPLELVMLPPADASIPMPGLLGTVKLDIKKVEDLNGLITRLVLASPAVKIAQAIDARGNGMLTVNGLPLQLYFDIRQQRLFFISGAMTAGFLQSLVEGLKPTPVHPMHASEVNIDTSGQGLYGWVAPKSIIKVAQETGQPWGMFLAAGGLSESDGIAFGAGVAGGKQRLRIDLQMPHVGLRRFLPTVDHALDFKAAGKLDSLMSFSIPGPDDLLAIEQILTGMLPPESMQKYSAAKQQLEKRLGISVQETLAALGPELLVLFDEAGQYSALKLKDKALFQKLLTRLSTALDLKLEERRVNGQLYQHMVIPSWLSSEEGAAALADEAGSKPHPLLKHLFSLPTHAYWVEEGDYLVFAVVPQILIDRAYITTRTAIDDWLRKEQKVDGHASWMLASMQMEGLSQFIYSLELQGLLSLADIASAEIDMFSLPTARELGLPQNSGYSAKLDSTDKLLSLELSYEHNPAEILMGGNGVTGIAAIGILAAVAIPAYQDYTVRAKITQGLGLSVEYRNAIVGYYGKYNNLPSQQEMAPMIGQAATQDLKAVQYDEETGRLTLVFAIQALGEKNRLFLTPGLQEGQIVWTCSADIQQKYLPASCKN